MSLDRLDRKILKTIANDKVLMFCNHVPEYLAGKFKLDIDKADYHLQILYESGFIQWEEIEDYRQARITESGRAELDRWRDKSVKDKFMFAQNWLWPLVVTATGCVITWLLTR